MTEGVIRPLRALAEVQLGRQRSPDRDQGPNMVRYLRAANVKDGALSLDDVKEMDFTPAEQRTFALAPGDVLVSEGAGSLAAVGASSVWSGELDGTVCFQNTLLRLRPRPGVEPRFLLWWARHAYGSGLFASIATGANIYHLGAERVRLLPAFQPDACVQRAIADYLDAEISRIDALVVARQRQADLLRERPWTEFIASVRALGGPSVALRRALQAITDGPFGSAFSADDYVDEGAFVVRLGNIGFGEFVAEPAARIPETLYRTFVRHHVRPGDLLVAGLGDDNRHAGRAALAPDLGPMMVKGKCYCAQVDYRRAVPRYLALHLSSALGAQQVALVSHGSGRAMINLEIAKSLMITLPPLEAQQEVVRAFEESARAARQLAGCVDRSISLLLERREALITAAVTGQFEIPGVAA